MNCICLFIHKRLVEHLLWPGAGAIKMNQRLILPKKNETQPFICGDLQFCEGDEEMEVGRKKAT